MESLAVFLNLRGRAVILLGEGGAADAKRRLLLRAGARLVGEEDAGARIAVVAIADEGEAADAAARLRARGLIVNVVDRPALCDFSFPAIVDRAPVMVAIGTGGASAGLAKALRQRIEALLPAGLGALATALHAARPAIRARWPDAADRRRAIDAALGAGGTLDPLGEPGDVAGWIAGAADPTPAALISVRLVSADPDELTLRIARLLSHADRVYHRPNIPQAILNRARADAELIPCPTPPETPPPGLSLDLSLEDARA
ncbi:precorrin-2 dehydrogenase/sirohydrochlorin ferrochelatase family protein [Sphingomonas quercus]|uniref:precorrin-2 dehydrogenase n=1 Tax=Sphingomonas quercus TaxID=2842451 RepID=A0ABS6BF32_9SPHN|nr:siroheme synthase [Sphingomonas quercus]